MDILISANEKILAMMQNTDKLSENMTETQYFQWLQDILEAVIVVDTDLKKSQFNYVSHNLQGYFLYNTLYNSLTLLTDDEYSQYLSLDFGSKEIKENLANQGIIVNYEIDELKWYNIFAYLDTKYSKSKPSLTITPTMECNARCFYCYENGVRYGRMKEQSANKIIEAIKRFDLSGGINLTWFGGEPLLNQEWMSYFSDCLRTENIDFSAFLISNGSLIDDNVIVRMKDVWNVESIQITFDGSEDEYAKRKAYMDQDEKIYYKMLKIIKKLSKAGIYVQIRLNIDRANVESIIETVSDLAQLYAEDKNVSCYPAFLTGCKEPFTEREKIDIIKRIIEIDHNKMPVNLYLYKFPKSSACYFNQKEAFSIDVNGDIYICEREIGHLENSYGNIDEQTDLSKIKRKRSGRRLECQNCLFLPKCMGGCQEIYDNGEVPCFIDKYIIIAYLEML